jgi:hypothetical protein
VKVERNLLLTATDLSSVNECLQWTVQVYDQEFTKAAAVRINIEQVMRVDDENDEDSGWHYVWTAAVGGLIELDPEKDTS